MSKGRRQMSRQVVVGVATLGAILVLGTGNAMASVTAQVSRGTLRVAGDAENDKVLITRHPAPPDTLVVDVGEGGSADFSFDRATFTAIDVDGATATTSCGSRPGC